MTKLLILALFMTFPLAPRQYHVQRIWVFSKTQYAGNIPRLPGGKQGAGFTNTLSCFLGISKNHAIPLWQTACFNGIKYAVKVSTVNQDSILVGTVKGSNAPVVVKPDADCELLQLTLTADRTCENPKPGEFVLEGELNKKHIHIKTTEPVIELAPALMP
ncbi:MAG: hypothetical protein ACHQII_04060 [Bacteroidia bacterium]